MESSVSPRLQWKVYEDEQAWDQARRTRSQAGAHKSPTTLKAPRYSSSRRALPAVILLLAGILLGAAQLWREAQAGISTIEAELEAAILLESVIHTDDLAVPLQSVQLQGEMAMAEVVVTDSTLPLPYRTYRFYQHVGIEWLPTAPAAQFQGTQQEMVSRYFHYSFHQWDQSAVVAAAAELDTRYTQLHSSLGLPPPSRHEKARIRVAGPNDEPPRGLGWLAHQELLVPSPHLVRIPASLDASDLILQAVTMPLIDRALRDKAVPKKWIPHSSLVYRGTAKLFRSKQGFVISEKSKLEQMPANWRWTPLQLGGVRLWLFWEYSEVFHSWRKAEIRWFLDRRQPQSVIHDYHQLCQRLATWHIFSLSYGIPSSCTDPPGPNVERDSPPIRLEQLELSQAMQPLPGPEVVTEEIGGARAGGEAVLLLVTLLDYATSELGPERIPDLLEALGRHDSWEARVSAVYDSSAFEFEAGWKDYLQQEYNIAAAPTLE